MAEESKDGDRQSAQKDNGGSQSSATARAQAIVAAARQTVGRSPGASQGAGKSAGQGAGLSPPQASLTAQASIALINQAMQMFASTAPIITPSPRFGAAVTIGSGLGAGVNTIASNHKQLIECPACGDRYDPSDVVYHNCAPPKQLDMEAVRTIQTLTANGLSPWEIAEEMRIVVAYRWWKASEYGLTAISVNTLWPMDLPVIAKCANNCHIKTHSLMLRSPPSCGSSSRPYCRIHALKKEHDTVPVYPYIAGLVALWGEVIECDTGFLGGAGYPVGLRSQIWARAYKVPYIGPTSVWGHSPQLR